MATYRINKINFATTPTGNQTVKLEYKLATDPASSYALITASATVDVNGNVITSPLPAATGLVSGATYNLRASTLCHSPIQSWVETIIAP